MTASARRTRRDNQFHHFVGIALVIIALVVVFRQGMPTRRIPLLPTTGGTAVATGVLGQSDGSDKPHYTSNGPNNAPNARGFVAPTGVAIDGVNHRLFLNDIGSNRILVFNLNADNTLTDRVADYVIGQPDFKSGTEATSQNGLNDMYGLAYDGVHNRLFVADRGNNRVLVFGMQDGVTNGMQATFELGQPDDGNPFDSAVAATTQSGMSAPRSVTYDEINDRLFVAEQANNRVLVFDLSDGITNGMPASYVLGQPADSNPFNSNAGATTRSGMRNPSGVTYDASAERLFVADTNNRRVLVFNLFSGITNGMSASFVLGQPSDGNPFDSGLVATARGGMAAPSAVAYDAIQSQLFVADTDNKRILVFRLTTGITNEMPAAFELGQPNDSNPFDSAVAEISPRRMNSPFDVTFDATSNQLFVADANNRLLVFDVATIANGENAVDLLGQLDDRDLPVYTTNGINNTPNHQGFDAPLSVTLDTVHNRLFISDFYNNRVLVFNRNADGTMPDYDADAVLGQPDFKTNRLVTSAQSLQHPTGTAYDGMHDLLFVADSGNNRLLLYDTATITDGEPAVSVLGQRNFTDSGDGASVSQLRNPNAVSVEPYNSLLAVADTGNNRVVTYNLDPLTGFPIDSGADRVLGQAKDSMNNPTGVLAEVRTLSIWVADNVNNRVLRYALFGESGAPATHILGQADFDASLAQSAQNGMSGPAGISIVDTSGDDRRLLVTDRGNNRVIVFDISGADFIANGEDAVDVIGQQDFISADCTALSSGLCTPNAVEFDEVNGLLYIADTGNNRIQIYSSVPDDIVIPSLSPVIASISVGESPAGESPGEPIPSVIASTSQEPSGPEPSVVPSESPAPASGSEPIQFLTPSPLVAPPDTVAPVISLLGDGIINLAVGDTYQESGAIATDDADGAVTVVISGLIDTTATGSYTMNYNAADIAGNSADEVTRTVNVGSSIPSLPETGQPASINDNPRLVFMLLCIFIIVGAFLSILYVKRIIT